MPKDEDYVVIGLDRYNEMRDELMDAKHAVEELEESVVEKEGIIRNLGDQIIFLQNKIKGDEENEITDFAEDEDI